MKLKRVLALAAGLLLAAPALAQQIGQVVVWDQANTPVAGTACDYTKYGRTVVQIKQTGAQFNCDPESAPIWNQLPSPVAGGVTPQFQYKNAAGAFAGAPGLEFATGGFRAQLAPWIDPTHSAYGAIADDGLDDYAAIQAAINAAPADGATIRLPVGNFRLSAGLVAGTKPIVLEGSGPPGGTYNPGGTTLDVTAANVIAFSAGSNAGTKMPRGVVIRNLAIRDASSGRNGGGCIRLRTMSHSSIENVTCNGFRTSGIGISLEGWNTIWLDWLNARNVMIYDNKYGLRSVDRVSDITWSGGVIQCARAECNDGTTTCVVDGPSGACVGQVPDTCTADCTSAALIDVQSGTCSVASSTRCMYDSDCPVTETCNGEGVASTDAGGRWTFTGTNVNDCGSAAGSFQLNAIRDIVLLGAKFELNDESRATEDCTTARTINIDSPGGGIQGTGHAFFSVKIWRYADGIVADTDTEDNAIFNLQKFSMSGPALVDPDFTFDVLGAVDADNVLKLATSFVRASPTDDDWLDLDTTGRLNRYGDDAATDSVFRGFQSAAGVPESFPRFQCTVGGLCQWGTGSVIDAKMKRTAAGALTSFRETADAGWFAQREDGATARLYAQSASADVGTTSAHPLYLKSGGSIRGVLQAAGTIMLQDDATGTDDNRAEFVVGAGTLVRHGDDANLDAIFQGRVSAGGAASEAFPRFQCNVAGLCQWGDGAVIDTDLKRVGADVLGTTDDFQVGTNSGSGHSIVRFNDDDVSPLPQTRWDRSSERFEMDNGLMLESTAIPFFGMDATSNAPVDFSWQILANDATAGNEDNEAQFHLLKTGVATKAHTIGFDATGVSERKMYGDLTTTSAQMTERYTGGELTWHTIGTHFAFLSNVKIAVDGGTLKIDGFTITDGNTKLSISGGDWEIVNAATDTAAIVNRQDGATARLQAQASSANVGTTTSHPLDIITSGTARMTVASAGSVTFATPMLINPAQTECLFFTADDLLCNDAAGCAKETLTGTVFDFPTAAFDQTTQENGFIEFTLPDNLDVTATTAGITVWWTIDPTTACATATETVRWQIDGGSFANDEQFRNATLAGTVLTVGDNCTNADTDNIYEIGPNAFTHAMAAGEHAVLELRRQAADVADDYNDDAHFIALEFCYEIDNVFSGE